METVTQGDDSSLNIQNEYFNKARKNRTRVTVVLTNGQRISGFIRSFDKFTLILDTRHGDQMVFKHAISTVSPSGSGAERDHRGPRPSHGEGRGPGGPRGQGGSRDGGASRPSHGDTRQRAAASPSGKSFGNFMDLSGVAKQQGAKKEPAAPDGASAAKADGAPSSRPAAESKPPAPASGPEPSPPAENAKPSAPAAAPDETEGEASKA